jgi:hypothetical protein
MLVYVLKKINRHLAGGFFLILLSLLPCTLVLAQVKTTVNNVAGKTAVFGELTGKVEVKEAESKTWVAAKTGMTVKPGTTIATGVRAKAVLNLGPSVLTVNQLTRMTLEELVEKQGTLNTTLFLKHGQVDTEVKGAEGLKHDFKLRSAVSTAAVRGTAFTFSKKTLSVKQGTVQFSNKVGQKRSINAGEKSKIMAAETVQSVKQSKTESSAVNPFAGKTAARIQSPIAPKAKVVIDLVW